MTTTFISSERERAIDALQDRVAEPMGVINAAQGELVDLVADALDQGLWEQSGVLSPTHWLAWQCGMSRSRARQLLHLARRRSELPVTVAALRDGELSVDQAAVVARHTPAAYDASVVELAKEATVAQLQRTLPRYVFDETGDQEPVPEPDAPVHAEVETQAGPVPIEPEVVREVSMGHDDRGGWDLRSHLPGDEGAVFEQAIHAAYQDLCAQAEADGASHGGVTRADALLAIAESYLASGSARLPGADRYRVHLHLEASTVEAAARRASLHLGPALPPSIRRLLTCDATVVPVIRMNGRPVNVGRAERDVPEATRRMVAHRDGCCRVPGCEQRRWLHIHHIVHWEDDGPTDTWNLIALCPKHHRQHHQGKLGIVGNADLAPGSDGAVEFRTLDGVLIPPVGQAHAPDGPVSSVLGAEPPTYAHPSGERLDSKWVTFNARPSPGTPSPEPASRSAPSPEAAHEAGPAPPIDDAGPEAADDTSSAACRSVSPELRDPHVDPPDDAHADARSPRAMSFLDDDGETIVVHGAGWDDVEPEPREPIDPWAILAELRRKRSA